MKVTTAKKPTGRPRGRPRKASKPDELEHSPEPATLHQTATTFQRNFTRHPALQMLESPLAKKWRDLIRKRKKQMKKKGVFLVKDGAELWEIASDYFHFLDQTPFIATRPGYKGDTFNQAYRPPPLIKGICAFIGISVRTWQQWKNPHHANYHEALADDMASLETMFVATAASQAATGELHANFISALLRLTDKDDGGFGGGDGATEEEHNSVLDKIRKNIDARMSVETKDKEEG